MTNEYKSLKIKLSSWRKLRRAFYCRMNETFSDYIERLATQINFKNYMVNINKE